MARKIGVNILAFGNLWMLVRSFVWGWDLKNVDKEFQGSGIGLMILPLRGVSKNFRGLNSEVLSYESWSSADFWPALVKLVKNTRFAFIGSPSSQAEVSILDRVMGMNYDGKGTIGDWVLFGNEMESNMELEEIRLRFPNALVTSHRIEQARNVVLEVHPELLEELFLEQGIEKNSFLTWLYDQELDLCVDTLHTFRRGRRDGSDPNPVVEKDRWIEFVDKVGSRIREVHFRLSNKEVSLILEGKAQSLEIFPLMKKLYQELGDGVFILEIYPDFLSSTSRTARKVICLWEKLKDAFAY